MRVSHDATGQSVVSEWLARHSRALDIDPNAAPPDLPQVMLDADVVGIAMGLRTGHESLLAAHALVRALVAAGFGALTLEGATATAERLDRWLQTGEGDVGALIAESQAFLHNVETLELLQWLRRHNLSHPEDPIELVFAESPSSPTSLAGIEEQLASTDLLWHRRTGQRVVHLGGIAHLVAGGPRTVEPAGEVGRNAGTMLSDEVAYACVAVTVGESRGSPVVPMPPEHFAEHALTGLAGRHLVDLRASADDAPPEVRDWLSRPLVTRCVGPGYDADHDAEYFVRSGSVSSAIAAVVHLDSVAPATHLPR